MSNASRRKGVNGENEAAKLWAAHGCDVRSLGGQGDRLIVCGPHGPILHGEYKRQERIQLWQWVEQAESEAASIAVPSVTFRPSHRPWYTVLRTEALAPLLAELGGLR
jgi:hypothetical protein